MYIKETPIHAMYHSVAAPIRFKYKGFPVESEAFHLIGEKLLYVIYECIQFYINIWLGLAVTRNEIDQSHNIIRGSGLRMSVVRKLERSTYKQK